MVDAPDARIALLQVRLMSSRSVCSAALQTSPGAENQLACIIILAGILLDLYCNAPCCFATIMQLPS